MYGITSLLLVVLVSMLVIRGGTLALVASGLSHPAARFQARSAFMGVGFTTSESEMVVNHPVRRQVIMALMLVGNAGIIAAVTSLILGLGGGGLGPPWLRVVALVAGILVLTYLGRIARVDRWVTRLIARILPRVTAGPFTVPAALLELPGGYSVSRLPVGSGHWLADRALRDLELNREGIRVLSVVRPTGGSTSSPTGATLVRGGDLLVVHGPADALSALDRRRAGREGDTRHHLAVERLRRTDESPRSDV